jgi:hypothetical protein
MTSKTSPVLTPSLRATLPCLCSLNLRLQLLSPDAVAAASVFCGSPRVLLLHALLLLDSLPAQQLQVPAGR